MRTDEIHMFGWNPREGFWGRNEEKLCRIEFVHGIKFPSTPPMVKCAMFVLFLFRVFVCLCACVALAVQYCLYASNEPGQKKIGRSNLFIYLYY